MLKAGAKVVEAEVRAKLSEVIGQNTKYESRSTGQLLSALGTSGVLIDKNGSSNIKIGFAEDRKDGKSNAISVSFEPFTSYDSDLDSVSLCDTVSIEYEDYGIQAKAKVTKTIYDTLLERYTSIVLGEAKVSMTDTLQKQISNVSVKATKQTERFAKRMDTAIDDATKRITGVSGGYVVTNADENGQPFEILIMDKPTIDTAKKIWRWNSAGLGYSSNGYEGPFSTAITADGSIVADFITSGALTVNLITAGTIQRYCYPCNQDFHPSVHSGCDCSLSGS